MEEVAKTVELRERESAFNRRLHTFDIVNKVAERIDIPEFLWDAYSIYESELKKTLGVKNMVKTMTIIALEYKKIILTTSENDTKVVDDNSPSTSAAVADADTASVSGDGQKEETIKETFYFATPNKVVASSDSNLKEHFKVNIVDEIMQGVENATFQGSGFTLSAIISLNVQVSSYEPLKGSSYVQTPKKLASKKAIINVQNKDNMCFKWAILSALHATAKHPQRVSEYKNYENELNFNNIKFPVSIKDIEKFEKQNETISVNVYFYEEKNSCVYPLRLTKHVKERHIHLLLLSGKNRIVTDGEETIAGKIKVMLESDQIRLHYCWIKHLSRLLSSQLSAHGHANYICDRCLNYFTTNEKLERHVRSCANEYQIKMPPLSEDCIKFRGYAKQLKAPFIVYADIEALLEQLEENEQRHIFSETCKTKAYQKHIPYSIGYYFKSEHDDSLSYYKSSGNTPNCVEWFVDEMVKISHLVESKLSYNAPMNKLTQEEIDEFYAPETVCFICSLPFSPYETRVRDHCHHTGKYRGPAHAYCNLNFQESREIPVVMHNLSGYDAHLIIKKLATQVKGDVKIIPNNSEQYISFTKTIQEGIDPTSPYDKKIKLKFIDSCRFMRTSLSELASLIPSEKKFILYKEFLKDYPHKLLPMLERKGVFPYDYVDSFERLNETVLPSREQFYSKLYQEEINENEYEFARQVWEKFKTKTLGEYSELYLKTDVLLLADVFENFRNTCYDIYKLDPSHYYTSPSLSFDAMLKHTDVEIKLITDVEMLLFIEQGVRGGISQCSKRLAKANNKYMKEDYNPNEKSNYIMYLDGKLILFFSHFDKKNIVFFNFPFLFIFNSKQPIRSRDVKTLTNWRIQVG